jgi:hypothetical protein
MKRKLLEKKSYSFADELDPEIIRQKRINEPLDFEKYKAIYAVYFKELTEEQYHFCHRNGIQWRIERGYDIDPNLDWDNQPNTFGIKTMSNGRNQP